MDAGILYRKGYKPYVKAFCDDINKDIQKRPHKYKPICPTDKMQNLEIIKLMPPSKLLTLLARKLTKNAITIKPIKKPPVGPIIAISPPFPPAIMGKPHAACKKYKPVVPTAIGVDANNAISMTVVFCIVIGTKGKGTEICADKAITHERAKQAAIFLMILNNCEFLK